jgi:hypothetical protein
MNRISGAMSIADSAREIHFQIACDRETGELIFNGTQSPEDLDEVDRYRFEIFWWGVLRQMESFFELYQQKVIDEAKMKSYAAGSLVMINNNNIMNQHWKKNVKDYSPDFRNWMNNKRKEFESETFV